MELGVVGLGRMGQIVVDRTLAGGHDVVAYDVDEDAVQSAVDAGAAPADSPADLYESLGEERRIWLMLPAGEAIDEFLSALDAHLTAADIVVDAGNSHYRDSVRRETSCSARYLDCGTSGGPASADAGFSLMVGGPQDAYDAMEPVFDAIATGADGHARLGPSGAGHYVKMVHNGIEYALMGAYGEGFELLADGRYDLDLEAVAHTWNHGAVIRSWLLELCEDAFADEGNDLGDVADYVGGGQTGTWTVQEALAQEIPMPLVYTALVDRFASRSGDGRFGRRLANRLRHGFGHHPVERRE